MDGTRQLTASRTIDAPIERVFAMLADPDRHPELDGSGMVRGSRTHVVLTGVGDVFGMQMYREKLGEYETDNVVITYERDRAIGWAPGPAGKERFGHTFTYRLEPSGDDRTLVTQTYDWSEVTDERVLAMMPVVTEDHLDATLRRLAAALTP